MYGMVANTFDTNVCVLVVEDEPEIRELMALHLMRQGFSVDECGSTEEAHVRIAAKNYQLIVLDWMLPGGSGFEFLKTLKRSEWPTTVLMVTAKTEPQDIVAGLEAGADDYLTKPFDPAVFLARARSLLRRRQWLQAGARGLSAGVPTVAGANSEKNQGANKDKLSLGELSIHLKTYEVKLGSDPLHLTPSEFKLLTTLLESQGRVLTRDRLIEQIQGEGINVTGRTIDTHVFGLRKKLGPWADNLETIRGVGYRVKMDPS
jgi:two-component system phosphate regulon response regulator PhoB